MAVINLKYKELELLSDILSSDLEFSPSEIESGEAQKKSDLIDRIERQIFDRQTDKHRKENPEE